MKVFPVGDTKKFYYSDWSFTRGKWYEIELDNSDDEYVTDDEGFRLWISFNHETGLWYAPGYNRYKFKVIE